MWRLLVVLVCFAACDSTAQAQTEKFRFASSKVPVGTVFHYEKSNIDGSHKSTISVYVADKDRLESLKWHAGSAQSTLVVAEMDWTRFSASKLQSFSLVASKEPALKATLNYRPEEDRVVAAAAGQQWKVAVLQWPWHSYDFDFASLNLTLPHLKDPESPFTIGIADVVYKTDGAEFAYKGAVECRYLGEETRYGTRCRKYHIDGKGLEQRGGHLWVDKAQQHLVDFEIALPDEPGFTSGKLRLLRTEKMNAEQWQQFKKAPSNTAKP